MYVMSEWVLSSSNEMYILPRYSFPVSEYMTTFIKWIYVYSIWEINTYFKPN